MAIAFFLDVLGVSLRQRENKSGTIDTYARLQLVGGSIEVRVKPGVQIKEGYTGQAFGSCRVVNANFSWKGSSFTRSVLQPFELETWVQGQPVPTVANSISNFLSQKK